MKDTTGPKYQALDPLTPEQIRAALRSNKQWVEEWDPSWHSGLEELLKDANKEYIKEKEGKTTNSLTGLLKNLLS